MYFSWTYPNFLKILHFIKDCSDKVIQSFPWGLSLLKMQLYSEVQPPEAIYAAYTAPNFSNLIWTNFTL